MTAPTVSPPEQEYHQLGVTPSVLAHWDGFGNNTSIGGGGGGGGGRGGEEGRMKKEEEKEEELVLLADGLLFVRSCQHRYCINH